MDSTTRPAAAQPLTLDQRVEQVTTPLDSRLPISSFAGIFPLLEGAAFEEFVADLSANGLREEITTYRGAILDGRNRYRGCAVAGIEPRYREYTGDDPLGFIISMNLRRRHLDESQRAMVAAKIAGMRQGARTDLAQICAMSQASAAAALSVSRRSLQHAKAVRTRGVPDLVVAVERGQVAVSVAAEVAALPPAEQAKVIKKGEAAIIRAAASIKRKRKEARRNERQVAYAAAAAKVPDASERYELHRAPCLVALDLLPPESVDLVITDPPYDAESMPVYTDLAKIAAHALKPGGLAFVMTGHAHFPETIARLGAHLSYYWTAAYLTPSSSALVAARKIGIGWKPVLVYTKAGGAPNRFFVDVVRSDAPDKKFHRWGQSESGFRDLLRHVVRPGDVILDPFIGGGTTAVAALKLGAARIIGFDADEKAIEATKARIAAMEMEGGAR